MTMLANLSDNREGRRKPAIVLAAAIFFASLLAILTVLLGSGNASAQTATRGEFPGKAVAPASPDCGPDWIRVASPNAPESYDNQLSGMAVIAPDDMWAVGYYIPWQGSAATLTEHWDGNSWTVVDSPSPNIRAVLYAVSAVSSNSVWAVGYYYNNSGYHMHTLIEHWNGTAWSVSSSPDLGDWSELKGVAAVGPGDVWAVGDYNLLGVDFTLTEHWDGSSWTVVPSINPGSGERSLVAATAVSTNNVWAVGYYDPDGNFRDRALAEHWDGHAWSMVNVAAVHDYQLSAISAASANDIWAVGGNSNSTTLTVHWDGTQWATWSSPSPGPDGDTLLGVVTLSATNAWAVGSQSTASNGDAFLLEHFDGNTWSTFDAYSEGSTNVLTGVGAVAGNDVWAVGYYKDLNTGKYRTVVERRNLCPTATPTRTPTRTPTHAPTRTPRPTNTPGGPTATPCAMSFSDVPTSDPFYTYINYLYCEGVISGYGDNTFRPGNPTTRGQLSKIVTLAAGWTIDTSGGPHFSDVPTTNPFYEYIETAYNQGVISGYSDGTFRWGNNVTRGQLSKIVVAAMQWAIDTSGGPHFSDVATTDPFYEYVETAYNHGIISGYSDGTFRPGSNATRGQICKIIYNAVAPQ